MAGSVSAAEEKLRAGGSVSVPLAELCRPRNYAATRRMPWPRVFLAQAIHGARVSGIAALSSTQGRRRVGCRVPSP